jgi:hypothetical protein
VRCLGQGRPRGASISEFAAFHRPENGPIPSIAADQDARLAAFVARLVQLLQGFNQAARARSTPVFNVKKELETEGVV